MEGNRIFVEAYNHDAGYLISKLLSLAIRGRVTFILALPVVETCP